MEVCKKLTDIHRTERASVVQEGKWRGTDQPPALERSDPVPEVIWLQPSPPSSELPPLSQAGTAYQIPADAES